LSDTSVGRAKPDFLVGVFDSGVGGLSVLQALRKQLPGANYVYLGDTARLPYGTKSDRTVIDYALQATHHLVSHDVDALVVACNTASSVALPAIQSAYPGIPVFGVVDPGARAACRASRTRRIAVVATESTVLGGAYQKAIFAECSSARVTARACPLLVTLAEEGWMGNPLRQALVDAYVKPWLRSSGAVDTLLLGCTHFPLLGALFRQAVPAGVQLVDSAETTAREVAGELGSRSRLTGSAQVRFLSTDDAARFARIGGWFLGAPISEQQVTLIDL